MKEFHPLAEIFPALDGIALTDLGADIRANGLREAIWLHSDGRILDGRNRYLACQSVGVKPQYRTYDGADDLAFVLSMNLARRHLNESQRAMVAARIATMRAGRPREVAADNSANLQNIPTQREAAKSLNVSERTIADARKVQQQATPEIIRAVDRGDMAVSVAAKLAEKPVEYQRQVAERVESHISQGKTSAEALKSMNVHVSNNSGQNEWYTPPEYIEAAKEVMGSIDLDPASSDIANKTVKAEKYFTINDDGLANEWLGNVWMNPPYSRPEIEMFTRKLTRISPRHKYLT